MRTITIFTASRSERPLVEPVIKRIEQHPELQAVVINVDPALSLAEQMRMASNIYEDTDIALILCDRKEMLPYALAYFYANKPIAHLFAGIYGSGTHDDVARHAISLFSHVLLCESEDAREVLINSGEEEWRCHFVGATHFDDMPEPEPLAMMPSIPYDLILVNPITLSKQETKEAISKAIGAIEHLPLFIQPNEDSGREIIVRKIRSYLDIYPGWGYETLPRAQFLYLLKNAKKFISNSSSIVYEAKYFGVPVFNPSSRNAERMPYTGPTDGKASERIAKVLASVDLKNPNLLKKRLRFFSAR